MAKEETKEIKFDAFGIPVREKEKGIKCDDKFLVKPKLVLDKETGSTKIDVSDKIDTCQMIQSYRDQVGVEAIMRLMAKGQLNPAAVADDGKHGLDISKLPDNINEARDAAIAAQGQKKEIAKIFGLDPKELTAANFEKLINAAVEKKLAEAKQKEVKENAE